MTARRLPLAFSPLELDALWATPRRDVVAAMRFLHATGMRSAEALSITTDEARSWPRPGRFRQRSVVVRIVGKGSKERVVLITNEGLRAARDLLPYSNGHLFPWTARGLRWLVAQAGDSAGVHAHPHRFRHTAITELVEAGNPIEVVADMAGHSSVNTTRIYYESSVSRRVEAERRRRRWRR